MAMDRSRQTVEVLDIMKGKRAIGEVEACLRQNQLLEVDDVVFDRRIARILSRPVDHACLPPGSVGKTRECREQQQRFDGCDEHDASKKRKGFAKNAGAAGECDEQAECLTGPGRRLEEALDEAGRGQPLRRHGKALESHALLRLGDRRLHLLPPVSDRSRRAGRGCDRPGRRAADILEPEVARKRQSGVRVDYTAGDAALHVGLAIEPVRGDEVLAQRDTFSVVGKGDADAGRRRIVPGERDGERKRLIARGRCAVPVRHACLGKRSMTSPLSAAIATRWLEDGTAQAVLAAIRAEAGARQQIAIERLAGADLLTDREGFHLWLKLPSGWNRGEFTAQLRTAGIGVVASDAFSISDPPEAVRLGLGAAPTRDQLRHSLDVIAGLLLQSPAAQNLVV